LGSLGEREVDILLNNTVLSNFGLVNRMELLRQAVEGRAGTTEEVLKEFHRGVELGYLPAISLSIRGFVPFNLNGLIRASFLSSREGRVSRRCEKIL